MPAPSRVADILLEQGRQAADLARSRGQIWGGAVQRLGEIPGEAIRQHQQEQDRQQAAKMRQQGLDIDAAHLQMLQGEQAGKAQDAAQNRAGDALQADSVKRHTTIDPESGHHVTDHAGVAQDLTEGGFQTHAAHYLDFAPKQEHLTNEIQTDWLAMEDKKNKWRLNTFGDIPEMPEEQRADLYTKRLASLPPLAQQDPVIKGLPPVYPGHAAMTQIVSGFRTDADRTQRAKTAATEKLATAKEAAIEAKATATEAETARAHQATDARALAAEAETVRHHRVLESRPSATGAAGAQAKSDVQESVVAMREGSAPPLLPGRATKEYLATIAEAHRQHFDIAGAATDWAATQKHVSTMNGAQQLRLNQAINSLPDMLDKVDTLASKWKGGRFPVLNRANLALAKGGAYGQDVASVANQLDAQIADVTADLGNVYMGGNSPTDHALGLAAKSLSGDWSEAVLHDMTNLARNNVKIRSNSIKHTGVAGASTGNRYGNQPAETSAAVPTNVAKALKGLSAGEHRLSDGSWWVIDASGQVTKK